MSFHWNNNNNNNNNNQGQVFQFGAEGGVAPAPAQQQQPNAAQGFGVPQPQQPNNGNQGFFGVPQQPNAAQGFGVLQPNATQGFGVPPQQQPNAYQGFQMSPQQQPAQAQQQPAFGPPVLAQQHPNAFQGFGGIPAGNQGFFQSPAVSQPATGKDNGNQGFGGVPPAQQQQQQQEPVRITLNRRTKELQNGLIEINDRLKCIVCGLGSYIQFLVSGCKDKVTVFFLTRIELFMQDLAAKVIDFDRYALGSDQGPGDSGGGVANMSVADENKMDGLVFHVKRYRDQVVRYKNDARGTKKFSKECVNHIKTTMKHLDESLYGALVGTQLPLDAFGYKLLVELLNVFKPFLQDFVDTDLRLYRHLLENHRKKIKLII